MPCSRLQSGHNQVRMKILFHVYDLCVENQKTIYMDEETNKASSLVTAIIHTNRRLFNRFKPHIQVRITFNTSSGINQKQLSF